MARLLAYWQRFLALYTKEIWQPARLDDTSLRGRFYAVLRVISITITVFTETKAASRASALSFSSLLGLGPLVAIAMLVAGMVLDDKDPDLAVNTLNRVIRFIAPQVAEYEAQTSAEGLSPHAPSTSRAAAAIAPNPTLQGGLNRPNAGPGADEGSGAETATTAPPNAGGQQALNERIDDSAEATVERMLSGFISGSRSGTAGAVGALTLILIVILLFKGIEDAFNEIWGLREGRSWLMRIIYYWTILTLGAVLFFASITLLSAGAFVNVFVAKLPFGAELLQLIRWLLPLSSGLLVISMLTLFYRYIPNTQVYWRAAFAGAVIVALLLLANNFLAFIYVRRVVISRSLYGSLGIMPILMFGLYIFWLYVLIGGQISYAVQNARFRSSQAAWGNLSHASREHLLLLVFLTVARRFQDCLPACSASQLSDIIKAPTQIINECLQRLVDMRFLTPIPAAETEPTSDFLYQPARPLNRTSLADFKSCFESFGEEAASEEAMHALDPLLPRYIAALRAGRDAALLNTPLDQLVG
ncbi:hypothetical protein AXK11_04510 [Cephaloticoccus primus]|uniref:Uncharacterized protein n=1 Tax=Cephaloticoccus primus TaxID=1548207 RepID=A0A139SPL4_9BACT|nr:YihY/virulence factor BrkB family protein [Cephaloticoccus primus]KXU36420.1 hypothetical protein AXK11_04510 [Cephaloticoccus primus]